jgi:hypothetical protein
MADALAKVERCSATKKLQAMLVIGAPGSGKTKLAKALQAIVDENYGRAEEERTVVPSIFFEAPDPCTPPEISITILEALGDPFPRKRKRGELMKRTAEMIEKCEVKLIIMDNLQDVPARRARRGVEQVGVRIRALMDRTKCLWMFFGTEDAKLVVDADDQLIKRIPYRANLEYFGIGTLGASKLLKRLLIEVDKWLPMAETSCIASAEMAWRIYLASDGIFQRLTDLFDSAWELAANAGRERIDQDDLAEAFDHVHGPRDPSQNPFRPEFVKRRLNGKDEPFEILGAQ